MIAKNFGMTQEEAEKLKHNYGKDSFLNVDEIFPVIVNGISVLRDELNKHYLYWKTHNEYGNHDSISRIILCGGGANLPGVLEYLESSMKIKVENANVWVNIFDLNKFVPGMVHSQSLERTIALAETRRNPAKLTQGCVTVKLELPSRRYPC